MKLSEWSSELIQAHQSRPKHAELCHIVQHVVILHRMWSDATEFRFGKEPGANGTAAVV